MRRIPSIIYSPIVPCGLEIELLEDLPFFAPGKRLDYSHWRNGNAIGTVQFKG
jgi:hypothetical protein